MKIYVASSWRNSIQPEVVKALRVAGHEVYDFKNPRPGNHGFGWSQIDPNWKEWTPGQYLSALDHPLAEEGFASDFEAMDWADCFVGVQPFGRSASMEMGWAEGRGKLTILLVAPGEPELMVKMFDLCTTSIEGVIDVLTDVQKASDRMTAFFDEVVHDDVLDSLEEAYAVEHSALEAI